MQGTLYAAVSVRASVEGEPIVVDEIDLAKQQYLRSVMRTAELW